MNRGLLASISQLFFSVIGKVSFLLITLLLYKARSQEEMGLLALMLAVAMILATISECGMRGLLVREMARLRDNPVQANRLLGGAIQSRLYTFLPYLLSAGATALILLPGGYGWEFCAILLAVWFDSNGQVVRGTLRAFDRIISDAVLAAIPRAILLGICAYLYSEKNLTITTFAAVYFLISVLDYTVSMLFIARYTTVRPNLSATHNYTINLIKRGLPFIVLAILGTIYIRVGVMLLGMPKTPSALSEAAAYNLAGKFPEGVAFVPIALMNVAIPFLSRQSKNLNAISKVFNRLEILAGGLGFMIATGLVAFPKEAILLLSTAEYLQYVPVFQIYGATVFFSFIQYTYANLLLSLDKEHLVASRYGVILVVNILLNVILIAKLHALGAVIALLICEIAAVILDLWFLRSTKIPLKQGVLKQWGAIGLLTIAAAWFSGTISGMPGMMTYVAYCAVAGAVLLFLTQNPRSAQEVQICGSAD